MVFNDGSLTADEVGTLCLLACLHEGAKSYEQVANESRSFIHEHSAPSLDLLGHSIEILRLEGLIHTPMDAKKNNDTSQKMLTITDDGREKFKKLMLTPITPPLSDIGRLSLLLKIKFADLLEKGDKENLKNILLSHYNKQYIQYQNLLNYYKRSDKESLYIAWLKSEIDHIKNTQNLMAKIL